MIPTNLLFEGDNLVALRDLAATHAGQVQCVYLDPPYNTGATFEHYRDALPHTQWLEMMRERLVAIRPLLCNSGFICVQIDDRELAYLQLVMDEVFGRARRVSTVVVKMSELSGVKMSHVESRLPKLKEYLLIYAAGDSAKLRPIRVQKAPDVLEKYLKYYTNIIENPESPVDKWRIVRVRDFMESQGLQTDASSVRKFQLREQGRVVYRTNNPNLSGLNFSTKTAEVLSSTGIRYVWWEGKQMLFLKDHTEEYLGDLWTDISTINLNKEGGARFRYSKKPEALIARVLQLLSDEGDLVLDAFAGSGTTGAVAQKMGRSWIMMEQGEHLHTHIVPRLTSILEGTDRGGIQPYQTGPPFRVITAGNKRH